MKPQQECITAYVFSDYIYLLPKSIRRLKIEEMFKKDIRKYRICVGNRKESRHYLETAMGQQETTGIKENP